MLKTFGFYGGYVGVIAILIGKKDNFYKWLGVAGIAISFIGSVYYWLRLRDTSHLI
jgi:disulfide bond formation protein DsbB